MIFITKGYRTIVFILLLFPLRFDRYILRPSSGVCCLKFLIRSLMIFIMKGYRTIVFIFIVTSITFRPLCPPALFRCLLSKFLRRSLMIFIINGFRTIVFMFIVISTTFRLICPPAFFRCLSNSGTFTELRTTSFIESTGFACSDEDNSLKTLNDKNHQASSQKFRQLE